MREDDGWPMVPLKDASEHITVGFVGPQANLFVDDGVPLLRGQNVKPFRLDLTNLKFVPDEVHKKWKKSALEAGDVVIVRVGYPGVACVIPVGLGPLNAASLVIVRPDRTILRSQYLALLLNSPWGRERVQGVLVGSAQQVLNTQSVAALRVPIPPIPYQDAVLSIFGAVDDLIENNRRRIALLEQTAQAIYREWFVYFRYPGHDHDTIVDSPYGPMAAGWEWRPFSDLATFLNGFAFKPAHWQGSGFPIVKIKELKQGVTPSTPRYHGDDIAARYRVQRGDLLFSWSASLEAYLWAWEPALLNQHLFKVTPSVGVTQSWLFLALRERMGEFRSRSQGTTMKHIKRGALSEVCVVTPTLDVMTAFDRRVKPILDEVLSLSAALAPLEALRDLLLPKLVAGAIDVSGIDLDRLLEETAA